MGHKLTPKVNLEGTRLTFKPGTVFELNGHPRILGPRKYRYHSPLISAAWCSNHPQERMFELQKYDLRIGDHFQSYQQHAHVKVCDSYRLDVPDKA